MDRERIPGLPSEPSVVNHRGPQGDDGGWRGGLSDGKGLHPLAAFGGGGSPEPGEAGILKRPRKGVETLPLKTSKGKCSPVRPTMDFEPTEPCQINLWGFVLF